MRVGYARISADDQTLDLQRDALKLANVGRFVRNTPAAKTPRGRKGGCPRKLSPKDLRTVRALLKSGDIPVSTVAEQFRVARSMSASP